MRNIKFAKRFASVSLIISMVFACFSLGLRENSMLAATAHSRDEAVNWAVSQIGQGLDYDGAYGNQCVDLTKYYYQYLIGYGVQGNACDYTSNALPEGWVRVYGDYQPGDIAVFKTNNNCSVCTTGSYGHVGIITSADSVGFNAINQNYAGKSYCTQNWFHTACLQCAIRPDFTQPSFNPEGCSDSISGGQGNIKVVGWTFDRDAIATPIDVHVYLDDVCLGGWTAGVSRTDVDSIYHCGQFHGYDLTIPTDVAGKHHVRVYAINVGGGTNVLLGEGDVNILPRDSQAPEFEYAKIVALDAYGYTVECKVQDNVGVERVVCKSWSEVNDSNMINNSKATVVDDVYTFRVNVSEHNNDYGKYYTVLEASDAYGNSTKCYSIPSIILTNQKMPVRIIRYDNSLYSAYDEGLMWESALKYAKSMESNLASISDSSENEAVYNLINGLYKYGYYIGAYTVSKNTKYAWSDRTRFDYSNWAPNEPSYSSDIEFYACMINGKNGLWNDVGSVSIDGSSQDMGFVIETSLDLEESTMIETDTKIYKFYDIAMPYTLAQKFCEENGGYLACITSEEENKLISSKIDNKEFYYYIGANDVKKERTFEWNNSEAFEYTNWKKGEPNSAIVYPIQANEDYVAIDCDGYWRDMVGQNASVGFIAEFDKMIETPSPTEPPLPSNSPSEQPTVPPIVQPTDEPNVTELIGDVNEDGKVNLADANITLKAALGIITLLNQNDADVNRDNVINLADANAILKASLGIISLQ